MLWLKELPSVKWGDRVLELLEYFIEKEGRRESERIGVC